MCSLPGDLVVVGDPAAGPADGPAETSERIRRSGPPRTAPLPPTATDTTKPRHLFSQVTGLFACLGVVARGGVEPPTFRFSGGRSYQLSYLAGTPPGRWCCGPDGI